MTDGHYSFQFSSHYATFILSFTFALNSPYLKRGVAGAAQMVYDSCFALGLFVDSTLCKLIIYQYYFTGDCQSNGGIVQFFFFSNFFFQK